MIKDEIREQTRKTGNMTFKEKLEYFWTYYKWYLIGGIVALLFLINIVNSVLNSKDVCFMVAFLNSDGYGKQEALQLEATEAMGFDTNKYSVSYDVDLYLRGNLSTTAAGVNGLSTLLYAKDLDIMVSDEMGNNWIRDSHVMAPLDTFLSAEFLEDYKDSIIEYTNPEDGTTIKAFIKAPKDCRLYSLDLYDKELNGEIYVSIACTTQRGELAERYLRYLLG